MRVVKFDELFHFLSRVSKIQNKDLLIQSFLNKMKDIWDLYSFSFEERLDFLNEEPFLKEDKIVSIQVSSESAIYGQIICKNVENNQIENEELLLDLIDSLAFFLENNEQILALSSKVNLVDYLLSKKEEQCIEERQKWIKRVEIQQKRNKILSHQILNYEALAENSSDLILKVDRFYKILYYNKALKNLLDKKVNYTGYPLFSLSLFSNHQKFWEETLEKAFQSSASFKQSGTFYIHHQSMSCNCQFIPEYADADQKELDSILICIQNHSSIEQLRKKVKEKELLLQELHHRVKNNLMIISSFLSLQSNASQELLVKSELSQAVNRIESVALLHYQLFKSCSLSKVNLKNYVDDLILNIMNSFNNKDIHLKVQLDSLILPLDMAVSLGLCLNEAITNSFKHVFCAKKGSSLKVKLQKKEDSFVIIVKDDGPGFPKQLCSLDKEAFNSLGLQLIVTLCKQMNAKIKFSSQKGAKLKIEVPIVF